MTLSVLLAVLTVWCIIGGVIGGFISRPLGWWGVFAVGGPILWAMQMLMAIDRHMQKDKE